MAERKSRGHEALLASPVGSQELRGLWARPPQLSLQARALGPAYSAPALVQSSVCLSTHPSIHPFTFC